MRSMMTLTQIADMSRFAYMGFNLTQSELKTVLLLKKSIPGQEQQRDLNAKPQQQTERNNTTAEALKLFTYDS